ncbi:hypothetical protein J437_LFUL015530 [Ladona fulva]|uniref:Uncharacterized protein n=1 Tax=Ladona fulva TaxID=123851 RepID=A0A8K0KIU8_LADFU|nr:hypothetical protein J437_LFUL015530 [Ladona fulva]
MVLNVSGKNIAKLRREPLFPNVRDETEEHEVLYISGKDVVEGTLRFTILNCYDEPIILSNILKIHKGFEIQSISEQSQSDSLYIIPCVLPKQLPRGVSTLITGKISVTSVGTNECFVFFKIYKSGQISFVMKKLCIVVESEFTAIEPPQPLTLTPVRDRPSEVKFEIAAKKVVRLKTPRKRRSGFGKSGGSTLEKYTMPPGLTNVLNNGLKQFRGMTQTERELRTDIL